MVPTKDFINTMIEDVQKCRHFAQNHWLVATPEARSWIDPHFGWSIDYIMQHLASFATHYLPVIEQEISAARASGLTAQANYHFTPELEDLFNRLSYEGINAMIEAGHFKQIDMGVAEGVDASQVNFITIQDQIIQQLERGRSVDLEKIFIPALIVPDATFKLGDCFQFLVRHQILHFAQAEIIMNAYTEHVTKQKSVVPQQ